ncbi:LysR family transcriptional regulator [Caballeronia hypogeia]|uniref:LysR family transcriptional regulator n=1 Tax=Caballeronia hypogeia TaxID=1777140 RepID=A0A158CVM4_9BURK|nr:LysR family transcriptional regulator [Caballeronia hypogeia]SAK86405.1 LysR family transcriptional regulator [Caballeronia hypogeia]
MTSSSGPTSGALAPIIDPARMRLDLNLMRVFDVVMTERHVTRAAERLEMTQSSVSNALNRLRDLFKDQLFVKSARGVNPTPRAMTLWPSIHQSIADIYDTVLPAGFDAPHTAQRFRVSMGDLSASLLLPHLYRSMADLAPEASIFVIPHDPATAGPRLMRGEVDFIVSIEPPKTSVVQSMPLWSESYVVAARRGHPVVKGRVSLAQFCEAPQLAINLPGDDDYPSPIDDALTIRGLSRNVRMTVNQFSVATSILLDSDLIAALPARFAMTARAREQIDVCALPFTVPDIVLSLSWHQRSNSLPAHQWFKQRLLESATQLNVGADLMAAELGVKKSTR